MRSPKHTGRSSSGESKNGRSWFTRDELNHMKWYTEVMSSKKKRGDRSRINLD